MFKKSHQASANSNIDSASDNNDSNNAIKINENSLLNIVVGSLNVKRWNVLKVAFSCKTNEHFVTKLLDIAQEYLNR